MVNECVETNVLERSASAPPLRILIVGLNYAPELVGCGKYTSELAEDLVRRGHTVEVVTGPPYYPTWQVSSGYSGAQWTRQQLNGVKVHRTPLYVPKRPSGLRRLAHLASFGAAALPAAVAVALRFRPHIIFSVAPALSAAAAALATAKVCNAKTWLHVQDFEVDAAFDLGILKNSTARAIALRLERDIFTRFDRVSSISPPMVARLVEKGVDRLRTLEFRNWVNIDSVQVFASANTGYRKELGIPADRVVALYSGNMAGKQGLEMLAGVARVIAETKQPVTLLICGDGPAKAALQTDCASLDNVIFLPLQPAERLPELLGTADIHLLPQRPEAADLVLPSKLTGMLASGRPIVAMAEDGSALGAEVRDCGRAVRATSTAMAAAILELAQDRSTMLSLGAAARARAEAHWCQFNIINALESELNILAR